MIKNMNDNIIYGLPDFLDGVVTRERYLRWLSRKARSLRKRDQKGRYFLNYTNECYKKEIHRAILDSEGRDYYTCEKLNWKKMGKYNNEQSKKAGRDYWKIFSDAPSVDHYNRNKQLVFKICSILTNDMKSHMDEREFVDRCKKVIKCQKHRKTLK